MTLRLVIFDVDGTLLDSPAEIAAAIAAAFAAAGLAFIGVTWGYHRPAALAGAADLVNDAAALEQAILGRLEAQP